MPWKENAAIVRPGRQIRSAAMRFPRTVRRGKPHRLVFRQDTMLRTVGPSDADIGPVMTGIILRLTIDVQHPFTVGRPACSEIQMPRSSCKFDAVAAIYIAGQHLIAPSGGQMECQALGIGAKTESVRQSLARFGEIASLRTIELHLDRSPDFVFDDLYEQMLIAKQQHRRFKWRNPILSA